MISINWSSKQQHHMEVEPRRLVSMVPEMVEFLPEDFGYETTTEEQFVQAFHEALEDRSVAYQIAERFLEESNDRTWVDTDVDADDIEAEARS